MKIDYIIDSINGINGGTERQLFKLVEGFVGSGHDVSLYVLRHTEFTRKKNIFPCPIYCLGFSSFFSLYSIFKLIKYRRAVVSQKRTIIHGFFNDVALILPPLMAFSGMKVFTSRRDMGIWYTPSKLFFLRLFRSSRTRLICNCKAVAMLVGEKEWKSEEKTRVIYNCIEQMPHSDTGMICDWAPEKSECGDLINVVLVANVRPVKKIEDLIQAASKLRSGKYNIHYYVVGFLFDELYFNNLLKIISFCQLDEFFHFVGPVVEPRYGLDRFDIGVLTSGSEGLSNTIMEYLDAGLPVIASRVGGNSELLSDGDHGFLYESGNSKELAGYIYALATDIGIRKNFSAKGKSFIQRLNKETMLQLYENEYKYFT